MSRLLDRTEWEWEVRVRVRGAGTGASSSIGGGGWGCVGSCALQQQRSAEERTEPARTREEGTPRRRTD